MSGGVESERGALGSLSAVARGNRSILLVVVFLALSLAAGLAVDLLGFPVVSGIIVAWAVTIIVATVVFVVVPIYALGFVE